MIISRALLAASLLASTSHAFVIPSQHLLPQSHRKTILSSSLFGKDAPPSDEMIRKDIEAMREEAKKRLQTLNDQMEDMISRHKDELTHEHFLDASSFEKADLPLKRSAPVAVTKVVLDQPGKPSISAKKIPDHTAVHDKSENSVVPPPRHFVDSSLLHNTRWKVVINVGKNPELGEKPLLLHLVVDFNADKLNESDDLLQGSANSKVLEIKESWIGASSWTDGRQKDVRIRPTGGWKVLPGQGPKGIDMLRFFFDVEEEICHDTKTSTLRIPARRVYCTCGYFYMEQHHHNEAEAFKEYLRHELDTLVQKYENLTIEDENDESLISFDKLKRTKKLMELRKQIRDANKKIQEARVRDPEKSMLRLSRNRDVGVTKDGQVCYKEMKGLSAEYLVLGKMEMASIDKRRDASSPDSNELRP
jgi:hypothetical protein